MTLYPGFADRRLDRKPADNGCRGQRPRLQHCSDDLHAARTGGNVRRRTARRPQPNDHRRGLARGSDPGRDHLLRQPALSRRLSQNARARRGVCAGRFRGANCRRRRSGSRIRRRLSSRSCSGLRPQPISFAAGIHPTRGHRAERVVRRKRFRRRRRGPRARASQIGDGARIGANSYVGHETTIGAGTLDLSQCHHPRT